MKNSSDDHVVSQPTPQQNTEEQTVIPRIDPHQRSVRRDWMAFIAYVGERSAWMAQDLQRADSVKEQGNELLLSFIDPANCSLLRKDENKKMIVEFVLDFFQKISLRLFFPITRVIWHLMGRKVH